MHYPKLPILCAKPLVHLPKFGHFLSNSAKLASNASAVNEASAGERKELSFRMEVMDSARREKERRERMLTVSEGMKLYLKTIYEKHQLREEERFAYEQGKRHLANMMGLDPETISQQEISESIKYLFPSGLFHLTARPMLKHPDEYFPHIERMEVDDTGAPKHVLSFTTKPKFYSILSEINRRTQRLVTEYDRRQMAMNRGEELTESQLGEQQNKLMAAGSQWITKDQVVDRLREKIDDEEYAGLIIALEYMIQLPNAGEERTFIMSLRSAIGSSEQSLFWATIPEVVELESGRRQCVASTRVKKTRVKCTVTDCGTGLFTVDGHHYDEFRSLLAREVMLAPMIVAGKLGQIDVEASVVYGPGGLTVIPRAIRQSIALSLAALFPETKKNLRLAGLLDTDVRKRERCKINQPGARAKWIWKKR